jgi:hypothetical protein
MNVTLKRLPAEFGPETRFEVRAASEVPFRGRHKTELEALKEQLLQKRLDEVVSPGSSLHLRLAANEAAALATVTRYPLLVFPTLFEECADAALELAGE